MNILITGASGRLGTAIAAELGADHHLRLLDGVAPSAADGHESFAGSILNPDDAWLAVRGVDALIHTADPPPDLPAEGLARDQALLDLATRGTHVLFKAATSAGVKKLIYAGSLDLFAPYPDDLYISELYRPLPSSDMATMARYLGEQVCREFARDHAVTITCLRLGTLVGAGEVPNQPPRLSWLDRRDAARAFRCALNRDRAGSANWVNRWSIIHVCADFANPRFLIGEARRMGFEPEHRFDDA